MGPGMWSYMVAGVLLFMTFIILMVKRGAHADECLSRGYTMTSKHCGTITNVSRTVGSPAWLVTVWPLVPLPVELASLNMLPQLRETIVEGEDTTRVLLERLGMDKDAIELLLRELANGETYSLPEFVLTDCQSLW